MRPMLSIHESDCGLTGSVSTRAFQKLSAGNIAQLAILDPLVVCVGATVASGVTAIVREAGGMEVSIGGVAVARHANRKIETMASTSFVFMLLNLLEGTCQPRVSRDLSQSLSCLPQKLDSFRLKLVFHVLPYIRFPYRGSLLQILLAIDRKVLCEYVISCI